MIACQIFEKFVLTSSQFDPLAAATYHPPVGIDLQRPDGQNTGRLGAIAAQKSSDAGSQLLEGERLDQIIVRPAVQTQYPVLDGVLRCEQEHGSSIALA